MGQDSPEGIRLIKRVRDTRGGESPLAARPPEYSDMGNAVRFARQHGNDVRYCAELNNTTCEGRLVWEPTGPPALAHGAGEGPRPLVQTGGYWRRDNTGEVVRKAKRTVESIKTENESYTTPVDTNVQLGHYMASQAKGKIAAMLSLAESELPIPCTLNEFDAKPMVLNVRNGTIDLTTGEFYPARREDMLMGQTQVDYIAEGEGSDCPTWRTALQRMFALDGAAWATTADEEMMAYAARLVGYMLTGLSWEKACFLFYGPPSTGKGTFVETLLSLLGEDYAIVTATESLSDSKGFAQHPADLKAMQGKRLVVATETPARLAINKIKQITGGGDTMAGRGMRENWGQIKPTWKLLLQTNQFPTTADAGFYERLHLLPFDCVVPKREQQADLKETLKRELSGILNWALAGLKDYQAQGLNPPQRMLEASARMRADVDDVGRFLEECCTRGVLLKVPKADLYKKYIWWAEVCEGLSPRSLRSAASLGRVMKESGIHEGKSGSVRHWQGLDVIEPGLPLRENKIKEESDRVAAESGLFK